MGTGTLDGLEMMLEELARVGDLMVLFDADPRGWLLCIGPNPNEYRGATFYDAVVFAYDNEVDEV